MVAAFLIFGGEGGPSTWFGVGVLLISIGFAVYVAVPPPREELALECLETEFRPADAGRIESWMAAVEENLDVSWREYECVADKRGSLTGTAPYGDGEASIEFFNGEAGTYFDRDFQRWILFRCDGPLRPESNGFVCRCIEALGVPEYLDVFDEHAAEVEASGEPVEVRLEGEPEFTNMETSVRVHSEGVTVRHDG